MLRQLLFNLLLNGVQALNPGGSLKLKGEITWVGKVKISLEDDGPGVDPENLPRLFTPYFTTRQGGSGLGLAICKRIALFHGWEIRYESVDPWGARFVLDGIDRVEK